MTEKGAGDDERQARNRDANPESAGAAIDVDALVRTLVDRSPVATVITHGERHVVAYANPAFSRLVDRPLESVVGLPVLASLPAFGIGGTAEMLDRVYRTGKSENLTVEARVRGEQGNAYWTYDVTPFAQIGGATGLFLHIADSTDQVRAQPRYQLAMDLLREINQRLVVASVREQELAEQAARQTDQLNALLENISEGVTVTNGTGDVVLMNRAAREIYSSAEGPPRTVADMRRLDFRRLNGAPLHFDEWPIARALRGEQFSDHEVIFVRSDGTLRHLLFSGSAIRDAEGKVTLAINVRHDVTDLRHLEQIREDYIHITSHDLRAPLTIVLGRAQMIRLDVNNPEMVRANVDAIITSAHRMNLMIQDLLDSARIASGQMTLVQEPLDLRAYVVDLTGRLDGILDTSRIRVEAPEGLPRVSADAARLERILINLLSNAFKYSTPETEISLELTRSPGAIVTAISNHGRGIPPEELPRLFERYFRSRTSHRPQDGLGLGLYITKGLVEALGGQIWAESAPGQTTTFYVTLRLAPAAD
jgi:signal transduction histidine kinase